MKISKLFHWLYAFLMFLPVFFVAGRTFYTICNKNAYQSYSDRSIETINEVNVGATYLDYQTYIAVYEEDYNSSATSIYFSSCSVDFASLVNVSQVDYISLYPNGTIYTYHWNGTSYTNNGALSNYWGTTLKSFQFVYYRYNGNYTYNASGCCKVSLITLSIDTLDNAFEYSMDSINDTPLFSWAQTSFLSAPMLYITGLFGMPNNSPVITLLSYWLSISIVWLVFDLVMYVPLLVHRWIDRGILD